MPLIEAFGRACSQVTVLKFAELYTVLPTTPGHVTSRLLQDRYLWSVWYFSPGTPPYVGDPDIDRAFSEDIHRRRLLWAVKDWRPKQTYNVSLEALGARDTG